MAAAFHLSLFSTQLWSISVSRGWERRKKPRRVVSEHGPWRRRRRRRRKLAYSFLSPSTREAERRQASKHHGSRTRGRKVTGALLLRPSTAAAAPLTPRSRRFSSSHSWSSPIPIWWRDSFRETLLPFHGEGNNHKPPVIGVSASQQSAKGETLAHNQHPPLI